MTNLKIEREEGIKLLLKLTRIVALFTTIAIVSVIAGLLYWYYCTDSDLLYFITGGIFIYLPEFVILYFAGDNLYQKERKQTISTIKRRKSILK